MLSVVLLGFVLGLEHATDADHLVAVATIVSRERRFLAGAPIGALWGLGHTVTLGIAGVAVVALHLRPSRGMSAWMDLAVAAMLILLGAARLRDAFAGLGRAHRDHPLAPHAADHDHEGLETLHSHAHEHGGRTHRHTHLHPSRSLLAALASRRGFALRPLAVGAVHGMAGTAAISLLVLTTVPSVTGALVYLGLFSLGTIVGMTTLTAVMAYPLALAARFDRARQALAFAAGAGSIAFGVAYGWRLL